MQITITDIGIMDSDELRKIAARAVSNCTIAHFVRKNATPNAKSFPRSNYWTTASESLTTEYTAGAEAIITITHPGVALRYYGGIVKPKKAKTLAIPLRPEVAGMYPSEYQNQDELTTFKSKRGKRYLGRREGKKIVALWILCTQTKHSPDQTAIPTTTQIQKAITDAIN